MNMVYPAKIHNIFKNSYRARTWLSFSMHDWHALSRQPITQVVFLTSLTGCISSFWLWVDYNKCTREYQTVNLTTVGKDPPEKIQMTNDEDENKSIIVFSGAPANFFFFPIVFAGSGMGADRRWLESAGHFLGPVSALQRSGDPRDRDPFTPPPPIILIPSSPHLNLSIQLREFASATTSPSPPLAHLPHHPRVMELWNKGGGGEQKEKRSRAQPKKFIDIIYTRLNYQTAKSRWWDYLSPLSPPPFPSSPEEWTRSCEGGGDERVVGCGTINYVSLK